MKRASAATRGASSQRLFHFSEDPSIEVFEPRPAGVPSERRPGMEWLNGPHVWAVDEAHQASYMFPRDCPRVLAWLTPATTAEDRERWWGTRTCSMIAHAEWDWLEQMRRATVYRYEMPGRGFEPLEDDGWMWVSRCWVEPVEVTAFRDLFGALAALGVELRLMESLVPLRDVWGTSLHVLTPQLITGLDSPGSRCQMLI